MPEPTPRFLVIRLSSIGDIVHALPAVAALGETFPGAEIHWIVEARHAGLLEGNPFVRRLIRLDTLGWRRRLMAGSTIESIVRDIAALRQAKYDAAIDFQGLYKSALIARLSRSRERIGLTESWLREPVAGIFYTERVTPHGITHIIEMNMALVERLGARPVAREQWQFPLPRTEAEDQFVEQQLATSGSDDFMVVNPGGGWKTKCWAPENYADLIRLLTREFRGNFLLTGSADEEPLIREITQRANIARAKHFPSTITQFIALVRRAKLFLGGDTGPLHLAAAVRTPVVALYGPTDPARNGPFSAADITLWNRGPIDYTRRTPQAGHLAGISVESVRAAIHARLARAHG